MIANANIQCMHADPYFDNLEPEEEAFAEGYIIFTDGDVDPIVEYLNINHPIYPSILFALYQFLSIPYQNNPIKVEIFSDCRFLEEVKNNCLVNL